MGSIGVHQPSIIQSQAMDYIHLQPVLDFVAKEYERAKEFPFRERSEWLDDRVIELASDGDVMMIFDGVLFFEGDFRVWVSA